LVDVKWVFISSLISLWVMGNLTCQHLFIILILWRINMIKPWDRSEVFFKTMTMIRSFHFMVLEESLREQIKQEVTLLTALLSTETSSIQK
jgi:hypothetical protein